MITIDDFWAIDDHIKEKWGKKYYNFIYYCGLEPIRPMKNEEYFCTPRNSCSFASTGGDGVHFSFVDGRNLNGEPGPIVMTVPMADNNNFIVAEDLEEFFSIGFYVGWFGLEQLAYDFEETLEYFSKPDDDFSKEELLFLQLIRDKLNICHKPLTKTRLKELHETYFHKLIIGD